jgi:ABC-type glutathione transport system ATPase component
LFTGVRVVAWRTGSYILISHHLAVVRELTDGTLVQRRGTVVGRGPTARVLDNPGHPYTRRRCASLPRPGWKPRRRRQLTQQQASGESLRRGGGLRLLG